MRRKLFRPILLLGLLAAGACDHDPSGPGRGPPPVSAPVELPVLGHGAVTSRYSAELWVHEDAAYTTTRGYRQERGNTIHVWDVSGPQPVLIDSVRVERAQTLGDVEVSEDGRLLVAAVEYSPDGALAIFDLSDRWGPRLLTRYQTANTEAGVHTAELARVDGTLYAFLSVDPRGGSAPVPARLVIVDLSDPANPREVFARAMGEPYVHDVFVRDGYLFTAEWDGGVGIWDIGARGGSPAAPVRISTGTTVGGNVHNLWWFHDPISGSRRYLFVGEEQPGSGAGARGDVHVLDVSDLSSPREVAFFQVPDSVVNGQTVTYGTHNFWVDEERGILYAAYYNGGVRALDVRGDLGACGLAQMSDADRTASVRLLCDLRKMGREVGRGLADAPVSVWGVQRSGARLYASDMHSGLWALDPVPLHQALGR